MADENNNSSSADNSSNSFSFLKPDELDMLRENNAIPDDLYSSIQQKIAPAVQEQNMSVMQPEQAGLPGPEMVQETVPEAAPNLVPDMSKTPWLDVFTPEGLKAKAQEAAMSGNLDEADSLSKRLEDMEVKKEKSALEERDKVFKKYETDLKKAQTYNERAEKYGFAKIAEPNPEAYGIPQQSAPATDMDMVQANEPTVAEVQAAAAPARAVVAQQKALQNEQMLAAKKEQEAAEAAKLKQEQEAAKVAADVEESKTKDIAPWRRAFAIMLGSIGQGLAGGENTGLQAVQRIEDKIVEEKKYNNEQKKELRKQLLDEAKLELDKAKEATNNKESKYKIDKLKAEIQKLDLENNAALQFANTDNSKFLEAQDFFKLEPKAQNAYVRLPDGRFAKTIGEKDAAAKLRSYMSETGTVVPEVMNLRAAINDPNFSKLSLQDRAGVSTQIAALVGALRVPITGPGPMTEAERQFIVGTIGDPNAIFTLPSVERAKLSKMIGTIEGRVRNQYFNAGVDLPYSKEERIQKEVDLLHAKNPNIPRDVLESIRRKNKGQ